MKHEPEPEPTDEELAWLFLPDLIAKMEDEDTPADALQELVALSEDMGLYPAWANNEDWVDQAAEWLMALQPSGTIWFSAEHDEEAERRIQTNYESPRPVPRVTNKSLRKGRKK